MGSKSSLQVASSSRRLVFSGIRGCLSAGAIAAIVLLAGSVIDDAIAGQELSTATIAVIFGLIVVVGLLDGRSRYRQMLATGEDDAPLRRSLVAALIRRGPAGIGKRRSGDMVSLATDGVERVARFTGGFMTDIVAAIANPITIVVAIGIFIDWFSAVVLSVGIIVGLEIIRRFGMSHRDVGNKSRQARAAVAASYLDALQGLETLSLLRAATRTAQKLADSGEKQRQATMRLLARNQQLLVVIDLAIISFLMLASVSLAAWSIATGRFSIGTGIALVALTIIMIEPLEMVGSFFYIAMAGRAIKQRIDKTIAASPSADGRGVTSFGQSHPEDTQTPVGGLAPELDIRGLTFSYPDAPAPCLHEITLHVSPGEHVALKAGSGVGKSTLLSLIAGDLALQAGSIRIGTDTYTAAAENLSQRHSRCAVVAQHSWLFTGTVRDNLLIADPHASDEDLWRALERAYIADEIARLPEGLSTAVGERGGMLSGGQVQRLALARAFLSGRPLLLLDEPTSQIDTNSERHIITALQREGTNLTVIMATHRDSSTVGFDRVITLGGSNEAIDA